MGRDEGREKMIVKSPARVVWRQGTSPHNPSLQLTALSHTKSALAIGGDIGQDDSACKPGGSTRCPQTDGCGCQGKGFGDLGPHLIAPMPETGIGSTQRQQKLAG